MLKNKYHEDGLTLVELLAVVITLGCIFLLGWVGFAAKQQKDHDKEIHTSMVSVVEHIDSLGADPSDVVRVSSSGNGSATIDINGEESLVTIQTDVTVRTLGGNNSAESYLLYGTHLRGSNYSISSDKGEKKYDSANGGFVN